MDNIRLSIEKKTANNVVYIPFITKYVFFLFSYDSMNYNILLSFSFGPYMFNSLGVRIFNIVSPCTFFSSVYLMLLVVIVFELITSTCFHFDVWFPCVSHAEG